MLDGPRQQAPDASTDALIARYRAWRGRGA
jgi:hypothetical protein